MRLIRTKQPDTRTRDEKLLDLMAYQRAQDRGLLHMLGEDGNEGIPPRILFAALLADRNADIEPKTEEPEPQPAVPLSVPWVHVEWESGPGGDIRLAGGIRVF